MVRTHPRLGAADLQGAEQGRTMDLLALGDPALMGELRMQTMRPAEAATERCWACATLWNPPPAAPAPAPPPPARPGSGSDSANL